jgi:hypothetical protein
MHHGRGTAEGLNSTFNPVDSCVLDVVLGKDGEDVSVSIAAGGLLSIVGMDRDPEHNVIIEDTLPSSSGLEKWTGGIVETRTPQLGSLRSGMISGAIV